ncbi:unnamed protein product [Caenorhabditis angaria]|uniref:Serpentine Receptor, class H n=1 Tax=Caenorhabditis angaria TaxID=860376 RepID=A0A9P1N2X2_9PELO|nr:unnamed protein product [Caenorhabditis angaria]
MDICLNILVKPLVIFPEFCIYTLGILDNLFQELQIFLYIFSVGETGVSCICIMENRYHHIKNIRMRPVIAQLLIYFGNLSVAIVLIYSLHIDIPEQQSALVKVFKNLPNLPIIFYELKPPFVLSLNQISALLKFTFVGITLIGQFFILFAGTFYELYMITNFSMSHATRKLQKALFIDVSIQSLVPILCMIFPFFYFVMAGINNYFNQGRTNIVLLLINLHGIISVITMLLIHKPFRQFIFCQNSKMSEKRRKSEAGIVSLAWMDRRSTI